jgi:glycosyltransferase involved in cell wall biosynthesis
VPPLRVAVVNEAVHGHRTTQVRLERLFAERPDVEASFDAVPEPNRLERLMLWHLKRLGSLDLHPLRWRLRYSIRARRIVRRREAEADVVLLITQACALFAPRRRPYVVMADSTSRQFYALEYWSKRDRFSALTYVPLDLLERRAVRRAAAVVCWTDWARRAFVESHGVQLERAHTVYPGVDLERWGASPAGKGGGRRDSPLRLLMVATDVGRKGLPVLLEAVTRAGLDVEIDLVTEDPVDPRPGLRVHTGVRPDSDEMLTRYAEADIAVLPTYADINPLMLVEAMAAGLPVVTTDVAAIPELLDGAGVLVPPGDVDRLAMELGRLGSDSELRRRLGEAGRRRARQEFDQRAVGARLVEILREAAP